MPKESKSKEAKVSKKSTARSKKAAAAEATGEKKRRVRKAKDPSAPKRGLSAYMFFSQDHRKTVQADNPDAGFGEIGKILGERWKTMSDAEKAPYNKKAAADKQRYENEKAAASGGGGAAASGDNDDDDEEDEDEDD